MIEIFDNFFNEQDYLRITAESKVKWSLRQSRVYKDLTDDFYTKHCIKQIENKLNKKVSLYRAYSVGKFANVSDIQKIHADKNSTHTALFYVNPVYDKSWLGGTIIWTDKPNYIEFKPNRLVIFKAELEHTGTVFKDSKDSRIICVWKINVE